ncbi:MAG: hypothetical protein R3F19_12690 [Verrucomicrobiales bacterium]|nr:hypothetical protein [Verrucomicrobiae bacterium]
MKDVRFVEVALVVVLRPVIFTGDLRDQAKGGFVADIDSRYLHSNSVVAVSSKVGAIEGDAVRSPASRSNVP